MYPYQNHIEEEIEIITLDDSESEPQTKEDIDCDAPDTELMSDLVKTEIANYCSRTLPPRREGSFIKPYHLGMFLAKHTEFKVVDVKVTRYKVINYLIEERLVPCKVTSCHKLMKLYIKGILYSHYNWSEMDKHGRKPHLSNAGLQEVIHNIKTSTNGGYAMSLTEVRNKIVKKIREEWKRKGKLHLLPKIPMNTLT